MAKERFAGKYIVDAASGCWLWQGPVNELGYGKFRSILIGPGKHYAHRVSYERFVGPIPRGLDILHRCDVPRCVNPKHLYAGTQADNNRDRDMRGRHVALRGTDNGMAKVNEQIVRMIRKSPLSSIKLAPSVGIDAASIRRIRRRVVWKHVDG